MNLDEKVGILMIQGERGLHNLLWLVLGREKEEEEL